MIPYCTCVPRALKCVANCYTPFTFTFLLLRQLPLPLLPLQSMCLCVHKNSALTGVRGATVGDQLTAVDDCLVSSIDSWTHCIGELTRHSQHGYCLPVNVLHQLDISMNRQCACLPLCLSVFVCLLVLFLTQAMLC